MTPTFSDSLLRVLAPDATVTVFTGAGMSAESGVPTFRSAGGIWTTMKPEELASMDGFLRNPDLVWNWYKHRKAIMRDVQPHDGHRAIVQLAGLFPRFHVVTQNIDNLHTRAGSTAVIELHGNIERNYCMSCGTRATNDDVLASEGVPRCRACGGTIRPDVVWFGEQLPDDQWNAAYRASASADVFFSVGTSAVVYPAAGLPQVAKQAGAYLVEINPERTDLTPAADEFLQGSAGMLLPALLDAILHHRSAHV